MKKPHLSPSSIGVFKSCPRCFWADKNAKIARPRGPFPSLPGGVDKVMKEYHDVHRPLGETTPMIQEIAGVQLFKDQARLDLWRNWRSGLRIESELFTCGGAIDDLFVEANGTYSPYDYKSKGSEPEDGYPEKYYQHQGDIYSLLLELNGMTPSGKAYFRFAFPIFDPHADDGLRFKGKFLMMETDTSRAFKLCNDAARCLALPSAPPPSDSCEYCAFAEKITGL